MDRRQEQILSDLETLIAFGKLSVHQSDQVQFHGLVVKGSDGAEGQNFSGLGSGRSVGGIQGLQDIIQGAQVGGFDDFGLAMHALAVADIVVGVAFDELARETRH